MQGHVLPFFSVIDGGITLGNRRDGWTSLGGSRGGVIDLSNFYLCPWLYIATHRWSFHHQVTKQSDSKILAPSHDSTSESSLVYFLYSYYRSPTLISSTSTLNRALLGPCLFFPIPYSLPCNPLSTNLLLWGIFSKHKQITSSMCFIPSVIFHYSSNETKPYKMAYKILVALASTSLYNLTLCLFLPFSLHPSHTGLSLGRLTHQVLLCHETFLYAVPSACNTLFQLFVRLHISLEFEWDLLREFSLTTQM